MSQVPYRLRYAARHWKLNSNEHKINEISTFLYKSMKNLCCQCIGQLYTITLLLSDILGVAWKGVLGNSQLPSEMEKLV